MRPGTTILRLLALVCLLLPAVTAAAPTAEPDAEQAAKPTRSSKLRWYVVPSVGFNTDDGLGFGVRGEVQKPDPEVTPYSVGLVLDAFVTLRGFHHHRFSADLVGLGPKRTLRLTINVAYRQWQNDGYWGIGNGTTLERAFVGSFDREDDRRRRYRYFLQQPFGSVSLRFGHGRAVGGFVNLRVQYTRVRAYEGSLLAEHRPPGMESGFEAELAGGFIIDTREPEPAPTRGVFAELSLRASPDLSGHGTTYVAPFASLRSFHSVAPDRVVLAWRVMGEWLLGNPAFYEMARWGGATPVLGFGGFETLRGASFGRWRAPGRAIANVELRLDVIRHRLFKQSIAWQLVPHADLGVVWGAGELATAHSPDVPLHPSTGLGLHILFAEAFLGRLDVSVGPDRVTEPDGSITPRPYLGFYFGFGQTF